MIDFIFSWGLFILALLVALFCFGFTVFIHELGHFLAAKWKGMVVERFAIGFGPSIWSFKHDGVEYSINWIPCGGFVALPQMVAMEVIEGESDTEFQNLPPTTPGAKIICAFFGPLFSFLLALACATILYYTGLPTPQWQQTTQIGWVKPESPAAKAGVLPGDVVKKVNGQEVRYWRGGDFGVNENLIFKASNEVVLDLERESQPLTLRVTAEPDPDNPRMEGIPQLGFEGYNASPCIVDTVAEGLPAHAAGIQTGDQILSIDGQKVYGNSHASSLVQSGGEVQSFVVLRNGEEIVVEVRPSIHPVDERRWIALRWQRSPTSLKYVPPFTLVADSAVMIKKTVVAVANPDNGIGVHNLSGPLGILRAIVLSLLNDYRALLYFMAFLNVNLAILNLLPLPVLDGGHIVLATAEWLRKKPLNPKYLIPVTNVMVLVLVGFFLYVTFFDTKRVAGDVAIDPKIQQTLEYHNTLNFIQVPKQD